MLIAGIDWSKHLRNIFFGIDQSIYGFISDVYNFVMDLVTDPLFSYNDFSLLIERIYLLFGIVMLFKVALSLMSIVIKPENLSNSSSDVGKGAFVGRIITSLLLVVMMPTLFGLLDGVQEIILEEDVIGNLVGGVISYDANLTAKKNTSDMSFCNYENTSGDKLIIYLPMKTVISRSNILGNTMTCWGLNSGTVASPCFTSRSNEKYSNDPNSNFTFGAKYKYYTQISGNGGANTVAIVGATSATACPANITKVYKVWDNSRARDSITKETVKLNGYTLTYYDSYAQNPLIYKFTEQTSSLMGEYDASSGDSFAGHLLSSFLFYDVNAPEEDPITQENLDNFVKGSFFSEVESYIIEKSPSNKVYYYKYHLFLSTIGGIIGLALLIILAIDATIRMLKLIVLQVLAPFPIMSYIDKSTSSLFQNWIKTYFSVYSQIFLRLAAIIFSFNLIGMAIEALDDRDAGVMYRFVVIIGILFFAKEAPELIEAATGIKGAAKLFGSSGALAFKKATSTVTGAAGGAVKGLIQGGLGGMAVGAALGSQAGWKNGGSLFGSGGGGKGGGGMFAFGAGRDYVGKSMADGPDASGGIAQRLLQRGAAASLRGVSTSAGKEVKEFTKKDGDFDLAKKAYETAKGNHEKAIRDREEIRDKHKSGFASDQELKDAAEKVQTEYAAMQEKGKLYNDQIDINNKKVDRYEKEVDRVKLYSGKKQGQFYSDTPDSKVKRVDRV